MGVIEIVRAQLVIETTHEQRRARSDSLRCGEHFRLGERSRAKLMVADSPIHFIREQYETQAFFSVACEFVSTKDASQRFLIWKEP